MHNEPGSIQAAFTVLAPHGCSLATFMHMGSKNVVLHLRIHDSIKARHKRRLFRTQAKSVEEKLLTSICKLYSSEIYFTGTEASSSSSHKETANNPHLSLLLVKIQRIVSYEKAVSVSHQHMTP